MMILWIMAILFLILSLVLLLGRGGFLIAGYNTASPSKKVQYDEKKLCRVTGAGMLFITVLLFVMAAFGNNMPDWFVGFFLVATMADSIIMMVVANTKCYATNPDGSRVIISDISEKEIRINKLVTKWSLLFTATVFVIVGILLVTGDIKFHFNEDSFFIEASYYGDMTINYDKIENVEYREDYLKGSRSGGFGSFRLEMGGFESKELGSYTRYTYTDCHAYMILTLEGKKNPVVIAGKDKEETEEIYIKLVEKMGQSN